MGSRSEIEIKDNLGSTKLFAGTVTTTPIQIPAVVDKRIEELSIRCAVDQSFSDVRLEYSFDQVVWHRLRVGEGREEEPRGSITQLFLRAAGTSGNANYEVSANFGK